LAAPTGAAMVGFQQSGSGAVARTTQSKLRESVSVRDFGAVGDWNNTTATGTDDTAAFLAAVTYCRDNRKSLYVPATNNEYKVTLELLPSGIKVFGDGEMDSRIRFLPSGPATLFNGTPNIRNGVTEFELFDFILRDISLLGPGKTVAGVKAIAGDTYRSNFERYTIGEFFTGIESCGANVKIGKGRIYSCSEGVAIRPLRILWPATTTTIEASIDRCTIGAWIDHVYVASGGVWPQTSGFGGATNIVFKNSIIELCDTGYKINRASGVTFLNSYAEQCSVGYDIDQSVNPTFINHGEFENGGNTRQWNGVGERDSGYFEVGTWGVNASRLFVGSGNNSKGGTGSPFLLPPSGGMPGRNLRGYFSGGVAFTRDPDATTKDAFWMGTQAAPGQYRWRVDPTATQMQMDSYTDAGGFSRNGFSFHQATGNWIFGGGTPPSAFKIAINGGVGPTSDNSHDLGSAAGRWRDTYTRQVRPGAGTAIWTSGAGTPEGVLTAVVGSLYTRTDGGAGTTLYVKESGAGNTGWVAK